MASQQLPAKTSQAWKSAGREAVPRPTLRRSSAAPQLKKVSSTTQLQNGPRPSKYTPLSILFRLTLRPAPEIIFQSESFDLFRAMNEALEWRRYQVLLVCERALIVVTDRIIIYSHLSFIRSFFSPNNGHSEPYKLWLPRLMLWLFTSTLSIYLLFRHMNLVSFPNQLIGYKWGLGRSFFNEFLFSEIK